MSGDCPPLVLVVSSGRCGSTMLSDLLNLHPQVLSVSELFAVLREPFPEGTVSGEDFWRLLGQMTPATEVLVRWGVPVEDLYPFGRGRFSREQGVPAICLIALPHLTDDPDGLYDELGEVVPSWPPALVGDQYRRLFGWLAARFGHTTVVERSGASLPMLADMMRIFPDATVVHLYRNGPETALSMTRHAAFRIGVQSLEMLRTLGVNPWDDPGATRADAALPDDVAAYLPDRFDVSALRIPIPIARFGAMWSALLLSAEERLAALPAESLLTLSYDLFVTDPQSHLMTLATFVGVDADSTWLAKAAELVRPRGRSSTSDLSADELCELQAACELGNGVLRRLGVKPPTGSLR